MPDVHMRQAAQWSGGGHDKAVLAPRLEPVYLRVPQSTRVTLYLLTGGSSHAKHLETNLQRGENHRLLLYTGLSNVCV